MTPEQPYRQDAPRRECIPTLALLDRHLSGELEPGERAVVEAHLAQCEHCRGELDEQRRVRDAVRTAIARTSVPADLADAIRARRAADVTVPLRRPALRWIYAAAATLVVAIGAWVLLRDTSIDPQITSGMTPSEVQLATVLSVGLTDHIRCAVDAGFGDEVYTHEEILEKLDERYAGLAEIVRRAAPGYRLNVGHRCTFGGRGYVHLILRKGPSVISLAITERRETDALPDPALAATAAQGLPIFAGRQHGYEVAGFESGRYLVFAISDLGEHEHLALASAIAQPVDLFLKRLPA